MDNKNKIEIIEVNLKDVRTLTQEDFIALSQGKDIVLLPPPGPGKEYKLNFSVDDLLLYQLKPKNGELKKVGIMIDNYKVDKYQRSLIKNGFINFKTIPGPLKGVTGIFVMVHPDKVKDLHKLCKTLEHGFKNSN